MGPLKQLALLAIFATAVHAIPERRGKAIGIFNVVKFPNDVCNSDSTSMNGTCYTSEECSSRDGVASGSCAEGYGVCCIITVACGGTTSENCTYLSQIATNTPSVDSTDLDRQCSYSICPLSKTVSRIRLDLTEFTIAGPGAPDPMDGEAANSKQGFGFVGTCVRDTFVVGNSPVICGVNAGQHMIVDTDGTECVTALFSYGLDAVSRAYTIHVTQYDRTNEMGGPRGCLQFYTGYTGTVSTFNWQTPTTSTHLANQNYDVCVRKSIDRCIICWSPITSGDSGLSAVPPAAAETTIAIVGSFGVSSSPAAMGKSSSLVMEGVTGCAAQTRGVGGVMGSNDFVTIQGGVDPGVALADIGTIINIEINIATIGNSNFCGRYFNAADAMDFDATICSRVAPFKLGVNFDGFEQTAAAVGDAMAGKANIQETSTTAAVAGVIDEPLGTSGFSLGFEQRAC